MNKIFTKFLLIGGKFMPELHLQHPRFTYSACGRFTKHRERIKKFRETGKLKHYIETNYIKLVLLMMQHIMIVKM